jgi:hypothetical protein
MVFSTTTNFEGDPGGACCASIVAAANAAAMMALAQNALITIPHPCRQADGII